MGVKGMDLEPITVKPKQAFDALGVGVTKGYELINGGHLEAIKIGTATRITWESVKAYAANAPRLRVAA
jgi:excisionase family DNA binding protein